MRADSKGLFWEDEKPSDRTVLKRSPRAWGAMPPIPDTGWRKPEFPNLSAAKVIGFDTETYDPELLDAGPGWGRGKGHIIGASISVQDGTSWYFPMRHGEMPDGSNILPPEHASDNMDPEAVRKFLDYCLNTSVPKVGANLIYDVGWATWEGIRVSGPLCDIQFAEALLNSEEPDVSLDNLATQHLGEGKVTNDLYQWLSRWNGADAKDSQRAHLYATPPRLAGPYAEADASLPIKILEKQWPKMVERGVQELFSLECRLIPLLVKMRLKGAPVDLNAAEKIKHDLTGRINVLNEKITHVVGHEVNTAAPLSMQEAFTTLGIPLPRKISKTTGKEAISFDKKMLGGIDHPFVSLVMEQRGLVKVRDTFVESYILEKNVNSRVYCSFHPLKGEKGGTRSGRFASADPNLQNIPVRSDEGKLVRAAFAAHHGGRWRSFDYSSIEYRLLANYAVGPGAEEVRAIFAADPHADYHTIVGKMIEQFTGMKFERGFVKTINFGIIYGMALPSLALALKMPRPEASALLTNYHSAAPYARATMDFCAKEVDDTGMVRTVLNRASDFNRWSKKEYDDEGRLSLSYEAACRKWGPFNIERSHKHKALNRKLQGSAADVMKKAMVDAYEAGLFEESACGIPILTVHDELDFEDHGDLDNPAWNELQYVMENCMNHLLRVPLLVDGGVGPSWAEAH